MLRSGGPTYTKRGQSKKAMYLAHFEMPAHVPRSDQGHSAACQRRLSVVEPMFPDDQISECVMEKKPYVEPELEKEANLSEVVEGGAPQAS